MKSITDLFAKYANIEPPARAVKNAVVKALKEMMDVDVPMSAVEFNKGTAFLSVPSVLKQEIRFHEHDIVDRANELLGSKKVKITSIR